VSGKQRVFIVGVQKAGTTTLHDLLARHPDIAAAYPKEPGFFFKHGDETGVRRLPSEVIALRSMPCARLEEYEACFAHDPVASMRLDSTTGYFGSEHARRQIKHAHPDARIIICLREPVSRAYSAYNWARKKQVEPLQSFENALEAEGRRREEGYWFWFDYTGTSLYADRVAAWRDAFEHVKIVLFDDLKADLIAVRTDILTWLGLDPDAAGVEGADAHSNPSGVDRSGFTRWLRRLVTPGHEQSALKRRLRDLIGSQAAARIKAMVETRLDRRLEAPPALSPQTRAQLSVLFADDIARTEALIGRDLSSWRDKR